MPFPLLVWVAAGFVPAEARGEMKARDGRVRAVLGPACGLSPPIMQSVCLRALPVPPEGLSVVLSLTLHRCPMCPSSSALQATGPGSGPTTAPQRPGGVGALMNFKLRVLRCLSICLPLWSRTSAAVSAPFSPAGCCWSIVLRKLHSAQGLEPALRRRARSQQGWPKNQLL